MSTFACRPKSLHRRICLATKSTRRGLRCGYRPARIILGVERVEVLIEPWSVDTRYRSRTNLSENKVLPIPSPSSLAATPTPALISVSARGALLGRTKGRPVACRATERSSPKKDAPAGLPDCYPMLTGSVCIVSTKRANAGAPRSECYDAIEPARRACITPA
jgi:hypothetical protein